MSEQEERKNQRISLLTSLGIHGVMVLLFIFVMGWTAPDPPLSEYGSGVELNFGLDDQGSGDVQSYAPAGDQQKPLDEKKEDEPAKEAPKKEEARQESVKSESVLTTKDDESQVELKDNHKEAKKVVPDDAKSKEVKKQPVDGKKEDAKGKDTETKKTAADNSKKTGANGPSEGDDKDKTGNKGKPEGTLDPNGQYSGKAGTGGPGSGGNGFGFKMAGWNWDEPPQQPKIPDNENGRIIFEIEVDANGDITKIKVVERGLSPEAVEICKEEIMKRSFVRTQGSGTPPEKSTGTITFNLKLK